VSLGQEWSGYAGMLTDDLARIEAAPRPQPSAKCEVGVAHHHRIACPFAELHESQLRHTQLVRVTFGDRSLSPRTRSPTGSREGHARPSL